MRVMRAPWELSDGTYVDLIQPREFALLPDGTELVAIDGERVAKGRPEKDGRPLDMDTRMGFLAFGWPNGRTDGLTYEVEIEESVVRPAPNGEQTE